MSRRTRETPALPRVNLLSESAFARLAARRLRHRFVAGGLVLVLLVAAAWAAQHARVTQTRKLVAVEQAETHRLTSQTQSLAPIRTFVNGVAVQQRTVQTAMSGEVFLSDVLAGVRDATPVGAQLTTVAVTVTTSSATADATTPTPATTDGTGCPGPDPFHTKTMTGCVTLSGTAASRAEVGDMVVALGDSPLFVEPFISTTTTGDAGEAGGTGEVTFSGSVGLSERVLSKRYGVPASTSADAATSTTSTTSGGEG